MNKVETAVRVRHLPTGLMVKCSRERSQSANKVCALRGPPDDMHVAAIIMSGFVRAGQAWSAVMPHHISVSLTVAELQDCSSA